MIRHCSQILLYLAANAGFLRFRYARTPMYACVAVLKNLHSRYGLANFRPVPRRNSGYTLIELSLVMAIVGVLIAGGLAVYMDKSESLKHRQTLTTMRSIDTALKDFYSINGFLPCPANGAEEDGAALFGVAVNYNTTNRTCTTPVNTAPGGMTAELRGVVPVRTIGLPDAAAYDGWGRKISYVVSPGLGSRADFLNDQNKGVVQIANSNGIRISNSEFGAAYAVFSHGKNGVFAYLNTGEYYNPGTDVGIEAQNASVADNSLIMGELSDDFDDILLYRTKAEIYLVRRLVRPLEIQKVTCTNARTIIDYGLSNFLSSTYGAYADHANKIFQVATAIDRLCQRGGPENSGSRNCIANLRWLDESTTPPRTHEDCYCPVDLEVSAAESLNTNYNTENFGGCQ